MSFTHDWFSNNIENWNSLLRSYKNVDNLRFLEIGCYEGRATSWLLHYILTGQNSTIDVVDTFEGSMEHRDMNIDTSSIYKHFEENVVRTYPKKVRVHVGYSQEVLRNLQINSYSFIYVDGSHKSSDVLEDAILSWRLLKMGGIMVFDDYGWKHYKDEPLLNPKPGIDAFLSIFTGQYELLLQKYQVAIRKP